MERGASKAMKLGIVHDNERYEVVKDIGLGKFGVVKLMQHRLSKQLVAVKYIERGEQIEENDVEREIMNHRSLRHPNIVGFKEVILTETHLGIVMEYAAGGELYHRLLKAKRFTQDEARFFFQQLISGVSYCHSMHVCHRDLKLENMLLDGSHSAPRLKICDFGYSKSSLLHSQPKSSVGTLPYMAPEVFSKKEYDGKAADVWSCGVALYVMLVGSYPFEDPSDPRNFKKTIGRILNVQYRIPHFVCLGAQSRQLLSRIFVADPAKRITIQEIQNHMWVLKALPTDLVDKSSDGYDEEGDEPQAHDQSLNEIMRMIAEARIPAPHGLGLDQYFGDGLDMDSEDEADVLDDSSGEFVCAF